MVRRKTAFSWRSSKYSVAFAVILTAAAVWVRAYELIPLVCLASWAYIRTDTFARLATWVEAHTPLSRTLLSWGMAAAFAVGTAAYVTHFIVGLGVYTTPDYPKWADDDGSRLCFMNKLRYGVARDAKDPSGYYRTHRVDAIRRGDHAIVETPAGPLLLRIVAKPGDTVRITDAALEIGNDPDKDSHHAIATFCMRPRTAYAERRKMEAANSDLGDSARLDPMPLGITFRDGHTDHADTTALRLPVERRRKEWKNLTFAPLQPNFHDARCYPHTPAYMWNAYQWGPIRLPRKGDSIELNYANVELYGAMVKEHEGAELKVTRGGRYTFKMNYYMTLCDDRDVIEDGRTFGPTPENKIIANAITL